MLRNKLVRSDGSIIDSSVIISCEYTEEVNSTTNLTVGDATASEITVEILNTANIQQDEVLTYYMIEDDVEKKIGVFKVEKPTVASRTSMRFSAYDNVVKTEKDFSPWLRENQNLFPMTLTALVSYACSYCGLSFATASFQQADLSISAFYADGITCRQILMWAASIACRFIRADADGALEFAWFTDASNLTIQPSREENPYPVTMTYDDEGNLTIESEEIQLTDDGAGNLSIESNSIAMLTNDDGVTIAAYANIPYLQGSLNYENYTTDKIERVQINHSEDDIGIIYPDDATGNCFTISGNLILGGVETGVASRIAESLYEHLKDIEYVPCSVTVPKTAVVRAGDIINVIDPNGKTFITYVMKVSISSSGTAITCTGDKEYGSNVAVASEKYENLTGKVLTISKQVDGLAITNADLQGKIGSLELTTEEFKTYVQDTYVSSDAFGEYQNTVSTQFQQTSDNFEMSFNKTKQDLDALNDDLRGEVETRSSYIRFEDGNIILGMSDSDITLVQTNSKISFMQNGTEVAYVSNNMLYITQGEFLTQLRIGKFGFTPGVNGNLSFRKVVN
jgi:hypothetical protein